MSLNVNALKRLGGILTGLTLMLWGASAQAKDIALSFEVTSAQTIEHALEDDLSQPTSIELSFDPPVAPKPSAPGPQASPQPVSQPDLQSSPSRSLSDLFAAGADSLVAVAVGNAEGTRTPEGGYTSAYYGHVDPGNGVWNLGSFSYQHGANSPQAADLKQLRRLKNQAAVLRQQASVRQLTLSLEAELNGIDLANQAPLAALDRGYIDWLHQAQQLPISEGERIVWARTRAFIDPDTGQWNAPGLGNTLESITWDQTRRYQAIEQVLRQ